ncbi:hypothetical protein HPB52_024175 [Rhipicephalus sanguineus]|uniref:Uncharacterized protein n=1 Tax=Rhipicephalus sanguineus TaxID=34632 RepID=A0A9D4PT36_RHISA|nr:hypothetical protein HPB52_024175 [Rhipicephalus sanguineus]
MAAQSKTLKILGDVTSVSTIASIGQQGLTEQVDGRAEITAEMGVLFHNGSEMSASTVPVEMAATSEGNGLHMRCSDRMTEADKKLHAKRFSISNLTSSGIYFIAGLDMQHAR